MWCEIGCWDACPQRSYVITDGLLFANQNWSDLVLLVVGGGVVYPHLAGPHPRQQARITIEHRLHVRRLRQPWQTFSGQPWSIK